MTKSRPESRNGPVTDKMMDWGIDEMVLRKGHEKNKVQDAFETETPA